MSRRSGFFWDDGSLLSWQCRELWGGSIRWNENRPMLVELDPEKTYALHYTINVRGPYPGDCAGVIFAKITPSSAFSEVLPLYFTVKCQACEPLTLQYSAALFPRAHPAPCADLSLLLNFKDRLFVDQASLSVTEL